MSDLKICRCYSMILKNIGKAVGKAGGLGGALSPRGSMAERGRGPGVEAQGAPEIVHFIVPENGLKSTFSQCVAL